MKKYSFGPAGMEVSRVGQGTWQLEEEDRERTIAALRQGLDAGLTHIDTAEMYGDGSVEALVAEAIAGGRDEVCLASKVLPWNSSYEGTISACNQSLRRLRTDHIDLYLLHWRGSHPLEETIRAFEELKSGGKIRAWGVSNFDVKDLEEAFKVAGDGKIACNQVLYHLGERAVEHAVISWCEEHSVSVVAYSPLGSGNFPSPRSAGGRVLDDIAQAHDVSPRAVALAFLTRRPSTFAIPRASHPEHVLENAVALDLDLEDAEIAAIDEAFPRGRKKQLPML